jgi:hypothetical protein
VNPIVHAELSWLLAQGLPERRDRVLITAAGLAPDLDGLSLLGGVEAYGRYHHLLFHGAAGAVVTAAACAAFARSRRPVAALALVAFHLHLLSDLAGSGPGWPLYYSWPFSRAEWFWSGQWDLASWQNSVIGMAATALCLLTALVFRRTAVEVLSLRADAAVTAALRRRFGLE